MIVCLSSPSDWIGRGASSTHGEHSSPKSSPQRETRGMPNRHACQQKLICSRKSRRTRKPSMLALLRRSHANPPSSPMIVESRIKSTLIATPTRSASSRRLKGANGMPARTLRAYLCKAAPDRGAHLRAFYHTQDHLCIHTRSALDRTPRKHHSLAPGARTAGPPLLCQQRWSQLLVTRLRRSLRITLLLQARLRKDLSLPVMLLIRWTNLSVQVR